MRQAQQQASQNFGNSQDMYHTGSANSSSLYGQLQPMFTAEATNPQGYAPKDLSAMNTASQQSIGGATAGAVGEGDLTAARTRNAGGYQAANAEAVRSGQRQLSENALGVQESNAKLKELQKQSGISGLSDLYRGNQSTALNAIGQGNNAVNAQTNAGNSGWFQNLLGGINAVSGVAKAFRPSSN